MSTVAVGGAAWFGLGPFVVVAAGIGLAAALLCSGGRDRKAPLFTGVPCAKFRAECAEEFHRLALGMKERADGLPAAEGEALARRAADLADLGKGIAAALERTEDGAAERLVDAYAARLRELRRDLARAAIEAQERERESRREGIRREDAPAEADLAAPEAAEQADAAHLPETARTRERDERLRRKCAALLARVREISPAAAEESAPLEREIGTARGARLAALRDECTLRLARAKDARAEAACRREELEYLLPRVAALPGAESLADELSRAAADPDLPPAEHERLLAAVAAAGAASGAARLEEEKRAFCARAKERLEALGYDVRGGADGAPVPVEARLEAGEAVDFAAPHAGYLVRVRLNGRGEFATRLVRAVPAGCETAPPTEYERQRDREVASAWCADYDRFLEAMRADGLPLELRLRREPEEEGILRVAASSGGERGARGAEAPPRRRDA